MWSDIPAPAGASPGAERPDRNWKGRDRWWLILLVTSIPLAAVDVIQVLRYFDSGPGYGDLVVFYGAGITVRSHAWSAIYDLGLMSRLAQQLWPGLPWTRDGFAYMYPPPMAWLFAPLSLLPFATVRVLGWAAGVLCVAISSFLLAPERAVPRIATASAMAGLFPLVVAVEGNNPVPVTLLLITLIWFCLEHDRDRWAGLLLAAALTLKAQDVVLLLVAFGLAGRGRAVSTALLAVSIESLISVIWLGHRGLLQYFDLMTYFSTWPALQISTVSGLTGGGTAALMGRGVVVGLVLVAVWLNRSGPVRRQVLIAVAGSFLIAPHLNALDFGLLGGLCLLLLREEGGVQWGPLMVALYLGAAFGYFWQVPVIASELGLLTAFVLLPIASWLRGGGRVLNVAPPRP